MLIFKKNGAGKQNNAGRPAKNEQAPPQNSEAFNLPYESKEKKSSETGNAPCKQFIIPRTLLLKDPAKMSVSPTQQKPPLQQSAGVKALKESEP